MNKKEMTEFEKQILEEYQKRHGLGAYDANAEIILKLVRWIALIVQHLNKKKLHKK